MWLVFFLVATALFAGNETGAQSVEEKCLLPDRINEERPNPDGTATKVFLGIRLIDISKIDDVNQTAELDMYVRMRWEDTRLAAFAGCRFPMDAVWNPEIILLNSGRMFPEEPDIVKVDAGGNVTYVQRYRGSLKVPKALDDFPFDGGRLRISLIPRDLDETNIQLVVDEKFTGRRPVMSIPDWSIGTASGAAHSVFVEVYDRTHSRYDFVVEGARKTGYYVWKVILPLVLIVFMSWVVFWINPAHFGPQIGMSATSMLTLIAFQFAMGNLLPRVNYFTRMDQFILGSTILVFLALVEAWTTSYLVTQDKKEAAMRIDKVCRWAFPVAFVGVAAFAFFA